MNPNPLVPFQLLRAIEIPCQTGQEDASLRNRDLAEEVETAGNEWIKLEKALADRVMHIDDRRNLQVLDVWVERTIRELRPACQWASPLIQLFRRLRTLIGRRIQLLLNVLRRHLLRHELVLIEIHFFEYNGLGRPPRMLSRALTAGLSQMTGRVCFSPALA
jgi:hypothetical protein